MGRPKKDLSSRAAVTIHARLTVPEMADLKWLVEWENAELTKRGYLGPPLKASVVIRKLIAARVKVCRGNPVVVLAPPPPAPPPPPPAPPKAKPTPPEEITGDDLDELLGK